MRRLALAAALTLTVPAMAAETPRCGPQAEPPTPDPRTCSLRYQEGQVYEVPVTLMGAIRVIFDEDDDASLGGGVNPDEAGFDILAVKNVVIIKPKSATRVGRVITAPLFTIDKHGKQREYDFALSLQEETVDGRTGPTRFAMVYPGRAEEKRRLAAAEQARQAAERRRTQAEPREQRFLSERLDVAHMAAPRNRRFNQMVEPGSEGAVLLAEMKAAGFGLSDNGQITTIDMPAGITGVTVFAHLSGVGEMMAPPTPKTGGTWVVPKVANVWTFRRGKAVFCLIRVDPIVPRNPGTGTIDPGVTIVPRSPTE